MFVRRIDTAEVHTVAGAAGRPVFWSPDSTTVFYSDAVGQLLKVRPALGVQEVVKTSTTPADFFNLSESGTLLGTGRNQCLVFRPLSGGEPKALELPPQFKNGGCVSPEFLRGGDDFIFLLLPENNPEDTAVYLSSIRDRKAAAPVLLLKNRTPAHYTPAAGGRLLYVSNDNLVFAEIGPAPTPAGWRHSTCHPGGLMPLLQWAMPSKYHSIHKNDLARAMVAQSEEAFLAIVQSNAPKEPIREGPGVQGDGALLRQGRERRALSSSNAACVGLKRCNVLVTGVRLFILVTECRQGRKNKSVRRS